MSRLSLIIPLFILSILLISCNSKAPTEGQLLNTYDIDRVEVVYFDTTLFSTSANIQVSEYGRRFLVFGSFSYLNVVKDSLTSYDVDLHQWIFKPGIVETINSVIFIQIPFSDKNSKLRLYGILLKGKYI